MLVVKFFDFTSKSYIRQNKLLYIKLNIKYSKNKWKLHYSNYTLPKSCRRSLHLILIFIPYNLISRSGLVNFHMLS